MFSAEDALARMVVERSATNPDFALLVEAYQQNSDLLDALTDARRRLGLSQRAVAQRMGTSQAAIDRLEAAEVDPKLSTIQRLAVALGGQDERLSAAQSYWDGCPDGVALMANRATSSVPMAKHVPTLKALATPCAKMWCACACRLTAARGCVAASRLAPPNTVTRMARPSDPPTCCMVWSRPAAEPDS